MTCSRVNRVPAAMSTAARCPTTGPACDGRHRGQGRVGARPAPSSGPSCVDDRTALDRGPGPRARLRVLLVAVHANAASSAPTQIAAIEAATRTGRRRSFGGGATLGSRACLAPPVSFLVPTGQPSVSMAIAAPPSACSPWRYWVRTCTSPMVISTLSVNDNGMVPLWPMPDQSTCQYDVARTRKLALALVACTRSPGWTACRTGPRTSCPGSGTRRPRRRPSPTRPGSPSRSPSPCTRPPRPTSSPAPTSTGPGLRAHIHTGIPTSPTRPGQRLRDDADPDRAAGSSPRSPAAPGRAGPAEHPHPAATPTRTGRRSNPTRAERSGGSSHRSAPSVRPSHTGSDFGGCGEAAFAVALLRLHPPTLAARARHLLGRGAQGEPADHLLGGSVRATTSSRRGSAGSPGGRRRGDHDDAGAGLRVGLLARRARDRWVPRRQGRSAANDGRRLSTTQSDQRVAWLALEQVLDDEEPLRVPSRTVYVYRCASGLLGATTDLPDASTTSTSLTRPRTRCTVNVPLPSSARPWRPGQSRALTARRPLPRYVGERGLPLRQRLRRGRPWPATLRSDCGVRGGLVDDRPVLRDRLLGDLQVLLLGASATWSESASSSTMRRWLLGSALTRSPSGSRSPSSQPARATEQTAASTR